MGIEIADLSTLDSARVTSTQEQLTQLLLESFPQVELRRGVIHDLVLMLHAILIEGVANNNTDRIRQSMSLSRIVADPTLADDELVDAVISNYNVTRISGQPATGNFTVVVTKDLPFVVPRGATFTAGGQTFTTTAAYSVKRSGSTAVVTTDRILTDLGAGQFAASFPVECTATGPAGAIRRGTKATPNISLQNLTTIYAESDFSGGIADETNADLLARLQEGAAVKAWSSRTAISAMIHAQPAFASTGPMSIIGCGDEEMQRDQHSLFPIAGGNRCDVYARTASLPLSQELVRSATFVDVNDDGSIWQVTFDVDDAPGMYEVTSVVLPTDLDDLGTFEVLTDTRDVAISEDEVGAPDIVTALEATYSAYQTATVTFLDTVTDVSSLPLNSTQDYRFVLSQMPQITELQDYLASRSVRWPGGDVLVKAPIPCFLRINFTIYRGATDTDPDTDAIRTAVAAYVNSLGFGKRLYSAKIAEVIYNLLPTGSQVGALDLYGRIRLPDGTMQYLRSDDLLESPSLPDQMTTARTMAFFLEHDSVIIAVSASNEPEV